MLRARQQRRRDLPAEGRRKENPFAAWRLCAKKKYLEEEKFKLDFTAGLSAAADSQASR